MADPIVDPEHAARAARTAKLFHDVFYLDVRGQEALAQLERRFIAGKEPVVTKGGIDAVLATYRLAAHREVLDYVHTQIDRFLNPPADRPAPETSDG